MMFWKGGRPRELGQAGVSLMEILIAIVILTVGFLGTGKLASMFIEYNEKSKRVTAATTLIQDKLEEFKTTSYSSISSGSETGINERGQSGGAFNRSWAVSTSGSLKTITVTVTWQFNGQTQTKAMSTAISQ